MTEFYIRIIKYSELIMKKLPVILRIVNKKLSDFYILQWIPIIIRLIFVFVAFGCNIAVRKIICPFV
jgi:hypothetical protein